MFFDYGIYKNLKINLCGIHQIYNAVLALDIAECIKDDFGISEENISADLKTRAGYAVLKFLKKERTSPIL